jgi:maltooligosyltrehalose trehalohydrolase
MVALTGRNEAYYSDYSGAPQELISAIKRGFLYQGQRSKWQKKRRGAPALDLHPGCFVNFIQNHDQVANTLFGERLNRLTSAGRYRAITALLLLGPATPMLFQGQEFAASAPFFYFADHTPELAEAIRQGRADFLSQFRSIACPESEPHLADPASETTFVRCKLDWLERQANADVYALHHDLLQLRRTDPVFSHPQPRGVDGAVLGTEAFVLRFFGRRQDDRLLFVNLGLTLNLRLAAEPLLAPLKGRSWKLQWSSEDPRYGGSGTPSVETKESWFIPGHAAMVLSTV